MATARRRLINNKTTFLIIAYLFLIMTPAKGFAYHLPDCSILDGERNKPTQEVLSSYQSEHAELAKSVDVIRLNEHKRNTKLRLASRERKAAKKYYTLLKKIEFWEQIKDLKDSLISLHDTNPPIGAVKEADTMAKDVIETLYILSQKWRIGSSALFTNFLINIGIKEKGFCYHYVSKLREALSKREWNYFDIHWGTAWENKYRENNALVITAKDRPFEEGLVIDAWRRAGRPFWTPVKGDRFPWVEEWGVIIP